MSRDSIRADEKSSPSPFAAKRLKVPNRIRSRFLAISLAATCSFGGILVPSSFADDGGQAHYERALALEEQKQYPETIEAFELAAGAGHVDAMRNLANTFYFGTRVEQDLAKAYHWHELAANAGDVTSMMAMGHAYRDGKYFSVDLGKALEWYDKAVRVGDEYGSSSARKYADAVRAGKHDTESQKGASVSTGNTPELVVKIQRSKPEPTPAPYEPSPQPAPRIEKVDHLERAWSLFYYGRYAEAWAEVETKANAGIAEAQVMAGFLKTHGIGTSESVYTAAGWYEKAAKQGNVAGRFMRNFLVYQDRISGSLDDSLTHQLQRANTNQFRDIYRFANRYRWSENPYQETKFPWLYVELGMLVELGLGTEANMTTAVGLYNIAARGDNPVGRVRLGYIWYHGLDLGTPNSSQKGMDLVWEATRQNYEEANRLYDIWANETRVSRARAQEALDAERRNGWGAGQGYGTIPFCYDTSIGDSDYYVCERK